MLGKHYPCRNIMGALAALATTAIGANALADDPKTANESLKYMRYNDPTADPDVYKVLDVILASSADEIKVEGCKTGPNQTLLKAKLINAGDTRCPNGVVPNHFIVVIPGMVEKVDGDVVTISYEVADTAGKKNTLAVPKDLISKKQWITPGAGLILYPEIIGPKSDADVIKDFKLFAKQMNVDPHAVGSMAKFSVQLK